MRYLQVLVGASVIAAVFSSTALASVAANDDLQLSQLSGATWAEGPFFATVYSDTTTMYHPGGVGVTPLTHFLTFCVETNNYFSNGYVFNIDKVETITDSGGHLLTGYSAWVYQQFQNLSSANGGFPLNGTWSGMGNGPMSGVSWADAFTAYQNAIWAGMVGQAGGNPKNLPGGSSGGYSSLWTGDLNATIFTQLGIDYDSWLDSVGLPRDDLLTDPELVAALLNTGNVRVMIIDPDSNDKAPDGKTYVQEYGSGYDWGQDQVVFLTQGEQTPEPASLLVWSLLVAGSWLGVRVWRRNRQAA